MLCTPPSFLHASPFLRDPSHMGTEEHLRAVTRSIDNQFAGVIIGYEVIQRLEVPRSSKVKMVLASTVASANAVGRLSQCETITLGGVWSKYSSNSRTIWVSGPDPLRLSMNNSHPQLRGVPRP